MTTTTASMMLSIARDAARSHGWRVFPLRPGDKRPAVKDWENRATTDAARVERCWAAGAWNVGVATGPSGLVVVDLDRPKPGKDELFVPSGTPSGVDNFVALCAEHGQPVPTDTYTVATFSGGRHLYFRHPETGPPLRNTASKLAPLVDTRAHGGYVVAAGSTVTGGMYTVVNPAPVAELPGWLAELLRPAPIPAPVPVDVDLPDSRRGAYLNAAITRQVDTIRQADRDGDGRKRALYHSAIALGQLVAGGELSETDVKLVLAQAAAEAGLWLGASARTIESGLNAGARRPRNLTGVAA
ncbi:MAG: bifunctional DNA primase/polymerase [Stackebrandtia sp.]